MTSDDPQPCAFRWRRRNPGAATRGRSPDTVTARRSPAARRPTILLSLLLCGLLAPVPVLALQDDGGSGPASDPEVTCETPTTVAGSAAPAVGATAGEEPEAAGAGGPGSAAVYASRLSGADRPAGARAGTEDAPFCPNQRPGLVVARAPGPIEVDGELDDAGWAGAARATNFAENYPEERARPVAETVVLVTYDDDNLYLGFIAQDDPDGIRVSMRDRDEIWSDDRVGILLDTYGDASWAYFLFANPLGIQADSRFATSAGEDDGFDLIYHSEGKVTEDGYQVEMAIPFQSLRFPDRPEQEWRVTFWRTHQRGSQRTSSWAALDRDKPCFLCQFGTIRGLEGIEPGGALELLPTVIASQAGALADPENPASGFDNGGLEFEPSLGLRYAFANGITAEGTLNPDFSQVESDAGQIDVNTTFALFFPERRPFFQEGSDLFDTWIDAVYTRSINDPQGAVRVTSRQGRTSLAYIGARDEHSPLLVPFEERSFLAQGGKSISNIVRAKQTFGSDESFVGFLMTDRRLEDGGGSNTVLGPDILLRFAGNYRLEVQLLGSHTGEPDLPGPTSRLGDATFDRGAHTAAFDGESFWGHAQYASVERSGRHWNFDFDYWGFSPTFRADNGFVTRNDNRRVSMWQGYQFWPSGSFLDRIQPGVFAYRSWNFDGGRKREFVELALNGSMVGQTDFSFWLDVGNERFRDVDFRGYKTLGAYVNSRFSDPLRLGFVVNHGDMIARNLATPLLGTGTDLEAWGTLKPLQRLVLEPSLRYSELRRKAEDAAPGEEAKVFSAAILRNRTSFQFTRELFLRLVVQYSVVDQGNGVSAPEEPDKTLDFEPLLTYKINPFTVFYVGSTMSYRDFRPGPGETAFDEGFAQAGRQFFAKFQYLLRL